MDAEQQIDVGQGAPARASLVLTDRRGAIAGRALRDGEPLGFARVSASTPADAAAATWRTQADADGRFEIACLPPGRYTVQIGAHGLAAAGAAEVAEVRAGHAAWVELGAE